MIVDEITSERLYIEKKSQVETLDAVNTYTSERRDWSNKGHCEGVASEVEGKQGEFGKGVEGLEVTWESI